MNKRTATTIFMIFLGVLLVTVNTYARRGPDLVVKDIQLVKNCKIRVTIANIGTAGVPASGYDLKNGAAIQMYRFAQPWGGIRLGAVDPTKQLMTPGKSVSWIWFPGAANLDLAPGTHSIRVVVDNNNAVVEIDENNNSRTERLTCKKPGQPGQPGQKLPDLIVKDIRLVRKCKIRVTIANIGTAGVPASGYDLKNGAAIQMYRFDQPWGGIRLGAVDTAKKLMTPGKSVSWLWFPAATNLNLTPGTHTIKVIVDNNNAVIELDETNNTRIERLTCRKTLQPQCPGQGFQGVSYERKPDNSIGPKIPNVTITFKSEDGTMTKTVVTSDYGTYKVDLCTARYYVTASHPDYHPYSSAPGFFVVTGSGYQTGNIFLKKK